MFSYGYNPQGPSISRLDQLLNRNELIYQNLKQKLDDINKSDLNIKRNITHIHSNYPPHISSYAQSSMIQQEYNLRSNYSQASKNLSSINESNQLTFSQMLPHEDFAFSLQREQKIIELMKESNRLREIQLASQRKKLQEELKFAEIQKLKKRRDVQVADSQRSRQQEEKSTRREVTPHTQVTNRNDYAPSYFPHIPPSKDYKMHKGNQIYLVKVPKTIDQSQHLNQFDNIATFRQDKRQQSPQVPPQQPARNKDKDEITFMQQPLQKEVHHESKQQQSSPPHILRESRENYQNQTIQFKGSYQKQDKEASKRENTRKQSPEESDFNFNAVSPKEANTYRQLNNNIQKQLLNIMNAPQCYLFMPFNKVYRSPILQIKAGGQILLERKSKTAPLGKDNKILDPIKYKFKSIVTDEQMMIKLLFGDTQRFQLSPLRQTKRVAILGKRDTLKKKLHMGLLAYLLESTKYMIHNAKANSILRIQHQQVGKEGKAKSVEAEIVVRLGSERIAILELERAVADICQAIRGGGTEQKVLRVSKIASKGDNQWSFSIICSNRVDREFVRCLSASRICWSVNPLIKNYQDVRATLQSMRHFVSSNSL